MRSELTLHHREAKEVQLFDSKKLCHAIKNILACGLWLEQVKRQKMYVIKMHLQCAKKNMWCSQKKL